MGAFRVRFDSGFLRQLDDLPGDLRAIARQRIREIAAQPQHASAKELDDHPTYFRMWLPRGHRLVYQVVEEESVIDLLFVGRKNPDLYGRLGLARSE